MMKLVTNHALFLCAWCLCAPFGVAAQQGSVSPTITFETVATSATAKQVDKLKIRLDTVSRQVILPVRPGTNLMHFKPGFTTPPGVTVTPSAGDFSKGPVPHQITISGKGTQRYTIEVKEYHNSPLPGLYADPDIIYARKTKKFYLYPTSDGITDWLGTSFKSFSSTDLVNWKDEGTILDLHKDVAWAENRAWAPTIIERKVNGKYKYFYYFCAEQKIGVATSNSPTGPFTDLGRPLLEKRPDGFLRKGQTIDPDVFEDPKTGKFYLFWGNGFMAGAELNDDMLSLKTATITELTPPKNYTEGTHVFYRNGLYYFLWSQHDTRDPNYRVRYGTTTSLLSTLTIAEDNLVIARDDAKGIYGTGHNSTIQLPGQDEWYLIYHRFTYPNGIRMGREAGYNREVCIDKLKFNPDGSIKPVQPTHEGIQPVRVKI